MIESIELTMSHVGLGDLNEYALMTLFGNAHSHRLVQGLNINASQITDQDGNTLYPAYFRTHLTVPPNCLLSSFKLWDTVDIGVDISKYGEMILSSDYIVGRAGQIGDNPENWDAAMWPTMRGNNLMTIDITGSEAVRRKVAVPQKETIAELNRLKSVPVYIKESNRIKEFGFGVEENPILSNPIPFNFYVELNQDTAPGHAMMFANFVRVMDCAERNLLTKGIAPGFPVELISHLKVLEREVYYYSNCFSNTWLEVYIKGNIKKCPNNFHGGPNSFISVFLLELEFSIFEKNKNNLLCSAFGKKLCYLPTAQQDSLPGIKRFINQIEKSSIF